MVKSGVKDGDIAVFAGHNMLWALGKEIADTFEIVEYDGLFKHIVDTNLDGGKKRYIAAGYKKSDTSFDIHSLIAYRLIATTRDRPGRSTRSEPKKWCQPDNTLVSPSTALSGSQSRMEERIMKLGRNFSSKWSPTTKNRLQNGKIS